MNQFKKIAILTLTLLILIIFSTTTYAQKKAKTGLIFGAQLGYAKANTQLDNWQATATNGNLFYGITAGFDLALEDYLATGVETGLFYGKSLSEYDETDGGNYKVSNFIVPVLAKIMLVSPIGVNFFLKGGISYVNPTAKKSGDTVSIDWKSSWGVITAIGFGYQTKKYNLFVQYLHIYGKNKIDVDGTQGTGHVANIDALTAGLMVYF